MNKKQTKHPLPLAGNTLIILPPFYMRLKIISMSFLALKTYTPWQRAH